MRNYSKHPTLKFSLLNHYLGSIILLLDLNLLPRAVNPVIFYLSNGDSDTLGVQPRKRHQIVVNSIHVRSIRLKKLKFGAGRSEQCREDKMKVGQSQAVDGLAFIRIQKMLVGHTWSRDSVENLGRKVRNCASWQA